MTAFFSEALGKHERSAFASGNERIDGYFRQTVSQDIKRDYAACYVLVEKASAKIAGFYTLSSRSIPLTELAEDMTAKLPRYPSVPAVLIGWLGRDLSFRGRHVGSMLLADAITRLAGGADRCSRDLRRCNRRRGGGLLPRAPVSTVRQPHAHPLPADEDRPGAGGEGHRQGKVMKRSCSLQGIGTDAAANRVLRRARNTNRRTDFGMRSWKT